MQLQLIELEEDGLEEVEEDTGQDLEVLEKAECILENQSACKSHSMPFKGV